MTPENLRKALAELQGKRTARFYLAGVAEPNHTLSVRSAMLIPEEDDHLIKLTDGQSIYIIDADRVAAVRIGTEEPNL